MSEDPVFHELSTSGHDLALQSRASLVVDLSLSARPLPGRRFIVVAWRAIHSGDISPDTRLGVSGHPESHYHSDTPEMTDSVRCVRVSGVS